MVIDMDRVNRILGNDKFKKLVAEIEELEKDRIYCHHDMDHALDVASIATIIASDEKLDISREIIYATALLHDIGRGEQYKNEIEHELAGAAIAPAILEECGFTEDETNDIVVAILNHGNEQIMDDKDLNGIIYRADKASRKCYKCRAIDTCKKPEEKIVRSIRY